MNASDPQFLYIALILPSLFGLTLIGEGLNKIFRAELAGIASIIFGILFVAIVIFSYMFLSGSLNL